jgi:nuclear transport factor 2 (NTF2) superfamily protein
MKKMIRAYTYCTRTRTRSTFLKGRAHPFNCRAARGQSERRAPRLRPERQSEHRLDSVTDQSSELNTHGALNQAVPAHRSVVCKTDSALRNICRLLSSRTRRRNFMKTVPNVKKLLDYIA